MSRIDYTEDEDFPGQFALWQGNCRRSMRGKAGQRALRELEAALLSMPDKRLWSEVFVQPTGEMCALGVLAVKRKMDQGLSEAEAIAVCADFDPDESQYHGEAMGFPSLVAWQVVSQNDIINDTVWEVAEGPIQRGYGSYKGGIAYVRDMTPAERYERVLAWVQKQIKPAQAEPQGAA